MTPANANLKELEGMIAEANKINAEIGKKLKETEDANERVEERRRKWKAFEEQFGEKQKLIEELLKLL